jgi:hypothetical protein
MGPDEQLLPELIDPREPAIRFFMVLENNET